MLKSLPHPWQTLLSVLEDGGTCCSKMGLIQVPENVFTSLLAGFLLCLPVSKLS